MHYKSFFRLFYCHTFCEIPRFINISTEFEGCIVSYELAWNDGQEGVEDVDSLWNTNRRVCSISDSKYESFSGLDFVDC